jgi:hypothetical protein
VLGLLPGCARLGPLSPLAPLERSLLFHAAPYPQGNWRPAGLAYEDAWFESAEGARLHGWFVPHPRPRAIVLFLHGNAGNITSRAKVLRVLHERHDLAVMVFDYRGYGRSEGKPNEQGILKDARSARAWLAKRTGVTEPEIVLIGRSLGGAVAVDLAAKDGARGLVLASTFTSLPDAAAHHFPWVPTHLLMSMRLDSFEKIKRYQGPVLVSHGDADRVVPYELGRRLFGAAPGRKKFVTLDGAGHNDPWDDKFHELLDHFLASLATSKHSTQTADDRQRLR